MEGAGVSIDRAVNDTIALVMAIAGCNALDAAAIIHQRTIADLFRLGGPHADPFISLLHLIKRAEDGGEGAGGELLERASAAFDEMHENFQRILSEEATQ